MTRLHVVRSRLCMNTGNASHLPLCQSLPVSQGQLDARGKIRRPTRCIIWVPFNTQRVQCPCCRGWKEVTLIAVLTYSSCTDQCRGLGIAVRLSPVAETASFQQTTTDDSGLCKLTTTSTLFSPTNSNRDLSDSDQDRSHHRIATILPEILENLSHAASSRLGLHPPFIAGLFRPRTYIPQIWVPTPLRPPNFL